MRFDFTNLRPGENRTGNACLVSREQKVTRRGDPYLVLEVANATGRASTRVWSEGVPQWKDIPRGSPISIDARIVPGWKGNPPELDISRVELLPHDHDVALELNPISSVPLEELEARLDRLIDMIERPEMRVLVDVVLQHKHRGATVRSAFLRAPAAVKWHHGTIGGILEHSIEVCQYGLMLAALEPYAPHVDSSLVLAGALLHDVGKIDEYAYGHGTPIGISNFGRLRSHLTRGSEIVGVAVANAFALEAGVVMEEDVVAIQHIIESHHGEHSFTQPRCMEAVIVHLADMTSARLRKMLDTVQAGPIGDDSWVHSAEWKRESVWYYADVLDRSTPTDDAGVGHGGQLSRGIDVSDDHRRSGRVA